MDAWMYIYKCRGSSSSPPPESKPQLRTHEQQQFRPPNSQAKRKKKEEANGYEKKRGSWNTYEYMHAAFYTPPTQARLSHLPSKRFASPSSTTIFAELRTYCKSKTVKKAADLEPTTPRRTDFLTTTVVCLSAFHGTTHFGVKRTKTSLSPLHTRRRTESCAATRGRRPRETNVPQSSSGKRSSATFSYHYAADNSKRAKRESKEARKQGSQMARPVYTHARACTRVPWQNPRPRQNNAYVCFIRMFDVPPCRYLYK